MILIHYILIQWMIYIVLTVVIIGEGNIKMNVCKICNCLINPKYGYCIICKGRDILKMDIEK